MRRACQVLYRPGRGNGELKAVQRGLAAELAGESPAGANPLLADRRLPDPGELTKRFLPDPASLPHLHIRQESVADYDQLLDHPEQFDVSEVSAPAVW